MATAWAIVNRSGDVVTDYIRRKRTDAIKAFVGDEPGWQRRWKKWRGWGAYASRVEVTLA